MERTKFKLREAQFFLDKMKERRDDTVFPFYFSAFLSAARSVTLYLQGEYERGDYSEEFESWYGDTDAENPEPGTIIRFMKSDEILKYMKNCRDVFTHRKPPSVQTDFWVSNPGDMSKEVVVVGHDGKEWELTIGGGAESRTIIEGSMETASPSVIYDLKSNEDGFEVDHGTEYHFASIGEPEIPGRIHGEPICDVAQEYLSQLEKIVDEWDMFVKGELDASDLGE